MQRRDFLSLVFAAPFAAWLPARAQAVPGQRTLEQVRNEWRGFLPAKLEVPSPGQPFNLPAAEWRKRLSSVAYDVLREEGTEPAGSSPLDREKRRGVFVCAGCGLPVFTSEMKYDSGTGWPSFFTTIPGAFKTKTDYKIIYPRTEYHCARCGGHHGHVFNDGPKPTGERWCNNGVALSFLPA
jgi:peptide-methionine (R)-S-oxide reductase